MSQSNKAKLKIEKLSVELGKTDIINDLSLELQDGEFVSIVGPSGCGKSTLLKTIAGINQIKSGTIEIDGEIVNDVPVHKRGVVILFQDLRLFPHMSVSDNVAYPLKLRGVEKKERYIEASRLLKLVQLEGMEERRISQLSGGQMQRVALARALAAGPRLLLLDEPFSALDEELREDMRNLLLHLHDELGMTTIMVTHDMNEARSISDRVIELNKTEKTATV